ncbi:LysR substrate-binding domain-containing protein [Pseudomonas sp. CFBP 5748]
MDLLQKVEPAAKITATGLEDAAQSAKAPSGTLRLLMERLALPHAVEPVLPAFRKAWPNLSLELTVSNQHENFAADGYDTGIFIGSYIAQDMIAVRLCKPFKWAVFGAPGLLQGQGEATIHQRPHAPTASGFAGRRKVTFIAGNSSRTGRP